MLLFRTIWTSSGFKENVNQELLSLYKYKLKCVCCCFFVVCFYYCIFFYIRIHLSLILFLQFSILYVLSSFYTFKFLVMHFFKLVSSYYIMDIVVYPVYLFCVLCLTILKPMYLVFMTVNKFDHLVILLLVCVTY